MDETWTYTTLEIGVWRAKVVGIGFHADPGTHRAVSSNVNTADITEIKGSFLPYIEAEECTADGAERGENCTRFISA